MPGSEIHGQGGNTQAWYDANLPGGAHTKGTEGKPPRKTGGKQTQGAQTQRDEQVPAEQKTGKQVTLREVERGFRYSTLSQHQLDSADPKNPSLTDALTGEVATTPPRGPGGTGNPFFRPNPMTTFFCCFLTMMQAMKELQRVANNLAITTMNAVKQTGLDQAAATIKAGEAQAKAEFDQAIISGVQAAVSGVMLITSIARDVHIHGKVSGQLQDQQKTALRADQNALKMQTSTTDQTGKLKGQKMLQESRNNPTIEVKMKNKDGSSKTLKEMPENDKAQATKMRDGAIKNREKADEMIEDEQKQLEKMIDDKRPTAEIKKQRQEIQDKMQERESLVAEEEFYKLKFDDKYDKPKALTPKELDSKIAQSEQNVIDCRNAESRSRQQADDAWHKTKEYDTSGTNLQAWQTRSTLKQQDPVYQNMHLFQGMSDYILQALKHKYKGEGDIGAARWNAEAQIAGTYNQILRTSLDSVLKFLNEAFQNANDVSSTLMKMSDQQTQSMHWAA